MGFVVLCCCLWVPASLNWNASSNIATTKGRLYAAFVVIRHSMPMLWFPPVTLKTSPPTVCDDMAVFQAKMWWRFDRTDWTDRMTVTYPPIDWVLFPHVSCRKQLALVGATSLMVVWCVLTPLLETTALRWLRRVLFLNYFHCMRLKIKLKDYS